MKVVLLLHLIFCIARGKTERHTSPALLQLSSRVIMKFPQCYAQLCRATVCTSPFEAVWRSATGEYPRGCTCRCTCGCSFICMHTHMCVFNQLLDSSPPPEGATELLKGNQVIMTLKLRCFLLRIQMQKHTRVPNLSKRKMSSAVIKPSNGEIPKKKEGEEEEVKNEYHVETNKELQVNLNFHNNNIISNIFSNLSLFDYVTNIFTVNKKTYMLKYCNKLNEDNFYISYFQKVDDKFAQISPWHDIDLVNEDGTYNMVVEITKYNYIKLEIQLTESFNVIKQDTKKGKLRYYHNSIYWNYGALPRTYEYPKHIYSCQTGDNQDLFFTGDDDPLDVVDVGQNSLKMGQIVPVKVLGAFTLIDEGQLDWKIIAINKHDKHFDDVNSLEDVEKYYPHTLNLLLEWFRSYKMAESKKLNIISKKLHTKEESEGLIKKTQEYYCEFLRDVKKFEYDQTSQSTCGLSTKQHSGSSDLSLSTLPKKSQEDSLYNSLLQDISISYHMADPTYRPNEHIWIH